MSRLPSATRAAGSPERFGIGGSDTRPPNTSTALVRSPLEGVGAAIAGVGQSLQQVEKRRRAEAESLAASERNRALTILQTAMLRGSAEAIREASAADPAEAVSLFQNRMAVFAEQIDGFDDDDLRVRANASFEERYQSGMDTVRRNAMARQSDRVKATLMDQAGELGVMVRQGSLTASQATEEHSAAVMSQVGDAVGEAEARSLIRSFAQNAVAEEIDLLLDGIQDGALSPSDLDTFMSSPFSEQHSTLQQRRAWRAEAQRRKAIAEQTELTQLVDGAPIAASERLAAIPDTITDDDIAEATADLTTIIDDISSLVAERTGRTDLDAVRATVALSAFNTVLSATVDELSPEMFTIVARAMLGDDQWAIGDSLIGYPPDIARTVFSAQANLQKGMRHDADKTTFVDAWLASLSTGGDPDLDRVMRQQPDAMTAAAKHMLDQGATPQQILVHSLGNGLPIPDQIHKIITSGFGPSADQATRDNATNLLATIYRHSPFLGERVAAGAGTGVGTAFQVATLTGESPESMMQLFQTPQGQTALSAHSSYIADIPPDSATQMLGRHLLIRDAAAAHGFDLPTGSLTPRQALAFEAFTKLALANIAQRTDLTASPEATTRAMNEAAIMAMGRMLQTHSFVEAPQVGMFTGLGRFAFDVLTFNTNVDALGDLSLNRRPLTTSSLVPSHLYGTEPFSEASSLVSGARSWMRDRAEFTGLQARFDFGFADPRNPNRTIVPLHDGNSSIPSAFLVWDPRNQRFVSEVGERNKDELRRLTMLQSGAVPPLSQTSAFTAPTPNTAFMRGATSDRIAEMFREVVLQYTPQGIPESEWLDMQARQHGWRGYEPRTQSGN